MSLVGIRRRARARATETPTGTPVSDPDRALLDAGRGDQAGFGRFYDLTSSTVFGIVLNLVRDRAIAEEITQEVYVETWRLAARYEADRGSAMSWVATIARRRAIDRVRSVEAARRRDDDSAQAEPRVAFDEVSETVTDDLERQSVRRALADLTDVQREAVTLAYYGGLTYRDVAARLDIPEGTAKTRIRDGLSRLRDAFGVTT